MEKKDVDILIDKIATYIITFHPQEICDDMNDILHSYIRDIFQNLMIKYGDKEPTDQQIQEEINLYFEGMYFNRDDNDDEITNSNVEVDIPELDILDSDEKEFFTLNPSTGSLNLKELDEILSEDDEESMYNYICKSLYDSIYKARMSKKDKEKIEEAVMNLLSYSSYHVLMTQKLWEYIYEHKKQIGKPEKDIYFEIMKSIHAKMEEMQNDMENKGQSQNNNKIIDFD